MNALALAQHNSLVTIVNAVFGDSKAKPPAAGGNLRDQYNDVTSGAGSVEEAVARINGLLTIGG